MTNVEMPADMHCRSCEQRVRRALHDLAGVVSVETDLKRQRVAVEFDEERVGEPDVRTAAAGALTHGVIDG